MTALLKPLLPPEVELRAVELPNPEAPSAARLLNGLLALRLLPDLARALEDAAATAPEAQRLGLYCEASRARDLLRETP